MVLPAMVHEPTTKTGNEVALYYNMGVGRITKRLYSAGETIEESCGRVESCPDGSFLATILQAVTVPVQPAFGDMPENAPLHTAVEGEFSPTVPGVQALLACLPNPADDHLICFDQSFEPSFGNTFRPIPRKFNAADHYVLQRSENTIRISDVYVSNFDGLNRLRGRPCTLIAKVYPNGGGAPSEVQYYTNVILSVTPISTQSDSNASIEITGDGSFSFAAIFSKQPDA